MSFVRVVVFNVFSAKAKFASVVVDELTGSVVINLGLFVGEGAFNLLWTELREERFVDLSLFIQLGFGDKR
jgi:hypothetical protein